MKDPTTRFSDRVANYTRYRPGYPGEIIEYFQAILGLSTDSQVADIGSGTGIFTRLLLGTFLKVYGVEPNGAMREEAERLLADFPGFVSISGSSEQTGLGDASVDFLTVAQAFHWFDQVKTKEEFRRVVKPQAHVALIWNKRSNNSAFLKSYESIVRSNIPEYEEVNHHRCTEEVIADFFDGKVQKKVFSYSQDFDLEGVLGRLLSSSYCPLPETDAFARIQLELGQAFASCQKDGKISFTYDTEVFLGRFC